MYHVSTLLPFSTRDAQQIQRKSHIGNDLVSIIFVDEAEGSLLEAISPDVNKLKYNHGWFDPEMIKSHFLTVYIVVAEYTKNDVSGWRVSVTQQKDVPPFGPALPPDGFFSSPKDLRDYLLTKVVHAESAAFRSAKFVKLFGRTRSMVMEDLVKTYIKSNGMEIPTSSSFGNSGSEDNSISTNQDKSGARFPAMFAKMGNTFRNSILDSTRTDPEAQQLASGLPRSVSQVGKGKGSGVFF
jgi:hypothetical protein